MSDTQRTAGDPQDLAAVEAANERIARAFMADWSMRDADTLVAYLADDIVYQIYDGGPIRNGLAEVRDSLQRFFGHWRRVEFFVERLSVIGPIVVNERREEYDGIEGQQDWRFHVAGLFVIENGRIRQWRDYSLPGKEQIFGPYEGPD
ncbi:MAG: nuclear transport factor 2 family protein [Gammaproteobacteria bacterium]